MKLNIEFGNGVVSLPEKTLEILSKASEIEIKLLVLVASSRELRENFSEKTASEALSVSEDDISASLKYLCNAGVLSTDESFESGVSVRIKKAGDKNITVIKAGSDLPTYTGAEIEEIFRQNDKLGGLVDTCQRVLGKMLTLIEINRIIALYDYYRLDSEYIEILAKYAVKIGKPSVPYIDKTARELYDKGVTTSKALEETLVEREKVFMLEGFVRKLFGLGERKLTAKETRFVEQWVSLEYPRDMIELAYEITIDNGKGASMPYMNKVLTNWRDAGHKSTEEVIASIERYRQTGGNKRAGTTDTTLDPFEAAILESSLKRARKLLDSDEK